MKLYSLLKVAGGNRIPPGVKILGLAALYGLGHRVVGVFMDPVLSCNLRCKMCFFSDPVKRAEMKGVIPPESVKVIAESVFPRALKLQIGCAAEPTLWPQDKLVELILLAKSYGVPYVSLTSNGQLLASEKVSLRALVAAGLDELTLSMHGASAEVYEELMPGARFENLVRLLNIVRAVKDEFPEFKLRINFTVNSLNVADLSADRIDALFDRTMWPDILQIRPVQKLGESEWNDFSHDLIREQYDLTIGRLARELHARGATAILPSLEELDEVTTAQSGASAVIEDFTYCYVSPDGCYKPDFDPHKETLTQYLRRKNSFRALLRAAFSPARKQRNKISTKKLNYHVK